MTHLLDRPLADIARAYREERSRVIEVVEEAIDRHGQWQLPLGAYIDWAPDFARQQALVADSYLDMGAPLGPLFGLPASIKDLFGVQGFRTRAGSPRPLPEIWEREGPMVRALRTQHGIVMGKTHTVHFAFGGVGANPHYPIPRNPWDAERHRVPGGSSSGAGVSLIEGSALIAYGSDTGGSVRIPASVTGTVGLKTSAARWSLDGIVPLSPTLDTAGVLTRTVADAVYAFGAFDPDWGEPEDLMAALPHLEADDLKIGVGDPFFWKDCSPGIAETVEATLRELDRAGAKRLDVAMPELTEAFEIFLVGGPVGPELYRFLTDELSYPMDSLDPNVRVRMGPAGDVTAADYLSRLRRLEILGRSVAERLKDVDVVATPTVSVTPPTVEEISEPDNYRAQNMGMLRNTGMVNYLGLCALTMPVGCDDEGIPVGLHLIARHGCEEDLLAVALACERKLGTGRDRLPSPPLRSAD